MATPWPVLSRLYGNRGPELPLIGAVIELPARDKSRGPALVISYHQIPLGSGFFTGSPHKSKVEITVPRQLGFHCERSEDS